MLWTTHVDDAFRPTGIGPLGDVPWGAHVCLFYETKPDFLQLMARYFSAGLHNREFCLWILPPSVARDEALSVLRRELPDLDQHLSRGNIELVSHDQWFFSDGQFDVPLVIGRYKEKLREALARGYPGLRANGSGSAWLQRRNPEKFSEYERELDRLIADDKMVLACSFELQNCKASDLLDATSTHQVAVTLRSGSWEIVEISCAGTGHTDVPAAEELTPRERAVLAEIVAGATSKQAAQRLGISPRTVEFHRANVKRKLGAQNVAELVRLALVK